jgi:CHAD domain-containing protein
LLGVARDLDVFVVETLARAGSGAHPGVVALKRRAQSARRRAGQAARAAVAAPDYTKLLLRFAALLEARNWTRDSAWRNQVALPQFAANVLSRQHARVRKRGRGLAHLDFDALHRLRIAVKRLRYAADFFQPLVPRKARDYVRALAQLQEHLGRINDDATAWRLLDALAAENTSIDYQQAVGFVRGWSARDAQQVRDQLAGAWARFAQAKPWW